MFAARLCSCALVVLVGCTEPTPPAPAQSSPTEPSSAPLPSTAPSGPLAAGLADAGAPADAGSRTGLPVRPVPKDVAVVQMDMSEEIQMKASGYLSALRAPHVDDPAADPTYAEELRKKLDGFSKGLDRGADKATMNQSAVVYGGRQIDLLMSSGCQPETPMRLLVQRAGVPMSTAYSHGVLAIRCNDKSLQCVQSTRDLEASLCTSAPRKSGGGLPGKPRK